MRHRVSLTAAFIAAALVTGCSNGIKESEPSGCATAPEINDVKESEPSGCSTAPEVNDIKESEPSGCATAPEIEGMAPFVPVIYAQDSWSEFDSRPGASVEGSAEQATTPFMVTSEEAFQTAFPHLANQPSGIDWSTERLWVLSLEWFARGYAIGWALEGAEQVIVNLIREEYCGDGDPARGHQYFAIRLPADDRATEMRLCDIFDCAGYVSDLR